MQTMTLLEATALIRDGVCLLDNCQSIDETAIGRGTLIVTTEGHFVMKVQVSFVGAPRADDPIGDPKLTYSPSTHSIRWWPENYLAADLNRNDAALRDQRHRLGYLFAGAPRMLAFVEKIARMAYAVDAGESEEDDSATLDSLIKQAREIVDSFGPPVRPLPERKS